MLAFVEKESIMVIKHKKVSSVALKKKIFMALDFINQILKTGLLLIRYKLYNSAHTTIWTTQ